ncbi:hypothetical protein [uncultured Gammaproteobacteria bacterium]|jgi:AAA15 family ATPase/GTPase|uniref:AAA family ATPase n=1 Tax=thiotrophic endosymbiont of Bathymodiolus puteoserpentis (Logatchev) TaxID=343240 RepID=UPI0010B47BEF|nr:ATP-binding protein [thiotrophic endosymbiont of Bathymodiolus puteoserpentis (Logatchev)]CAC9628580.1 hypothetical protein [uncultured Gammaproteobacteria bacterium]CAC9649070.1 hypothetical protein [uncultured Gammaproteobacteria bacterium]SSC10643.1 hypothetical protein BPUTEOSOX_1244 [thiotrophic endosymbiont of Bathymodiolus puteoserpentis (Logatchev)]
MLLEFSVTNFRSIKEKQTLSLLKTKKNELENNFTTVTLSTGKTLDVLNSAVIYGANASGKSNLVNSFNTFVSIVLVLNSKSLYDIEPFLLLENITNNPTEFEINFVYNGVRFVYGFSATQEKIIDEWLYQYPKGRPQALIIREDTNIWNETTALKGNKKIWQQSTKDYSLFFSTAVELNSQQLLPIYNFFEQSYSQIFLDNHLGKVLGADKSLNLLENNKDKVLSFMYMADLNISDIVTRYPEEHESSYYGGKIIEVVRNIGGNKISFDVNEESKGTRKIFFLVGIWLNALENGCCLVLDELQNSLHPKLVEHLVQMFHNPDINKKGAQLIFVTHETSLLNQEIFRRDQVWFCEKEDNATELFSLADFSVRKGAENIEKFYLSGRYGAVPYLR